MVFTNVEQVFPFLGGLHNDLDDGDSFTLGPNEMYTSASTIFDDDQWGESFVYAALLYEEQVVKLEQRYYTSGAFFFGGVGAVSRGHSAALLPTELESGSGTQQTRTYWVQSDNRSYLISYLQRGRLVFQVAFPCAPDQVGPCLAKLQEVNAALGLDDPTWAAAEPTQLNDRQPRPGEFWRDPYVGYYEEDYTSKLYVRTGMSPFRQIRDDYARARGVDYAFAYGEVDEELGMPEGTFIISEGRREPTPASVLNGIPGLREFTLSRKPTTASRETWQDTASAQRIIETARDEYPVFVDEASVGAEQRMRARTYFCDSSYLLIESRYPLADTAAARAVEDLLRYMRVNDYE